MSTGQMSTEADSEWGFRKHLFLPHTNSQVMRLTNGGPGRLSQGLYGKQELLNPPPLWESLLLHQFSGPSAWEPFEPSSLYPLCQITPCTLALPALVLAPPFLILLIACFGFPSGGPHSDAFYLGLNLPKFFFVCFYSCTFQDIYKIKGRTRRMACHTKWARHREMLHDLTSVWNLKSEKLDLQKVVTKAQGQRDSGDLSQRKQIFS